MNEFVVLQPEHLEPVCANCGPSIKFQFSNSICPICSTTTITFFLSLFFFKGKQSFWQLRVFTADVCMILWSILGDGKLHLLFLPTERKELGPTSQADFHLDIILVYELDHLFNYPTLDFGDWLGGYCSK